MLETNLKTVWNTVLVDTDTMEINNNNLRYSGNMHIYECFLISFDKNKFRKSDLFTIFYLKRKNIILQAGAELCQAHVQLC